MRVRQREQAYSIVQLKEYMPEDDNRMVYVQNRTASELKRSIYQIITATKGFIYRRDFPIDPAELRRPPNRKETRRPKSSISCSRSRIIWRNSRSARPRARKAPAGSL